MTRKSIKKPDAAPRPIFSRDSAEAKAVRMLHDIVGLTKAFFAICRHADGSVSFPRSMTVQLVALSAAPDRGEWATLTRQQAAAWECLLRSVFDDRMIRTRLREGSKAPWPWPPSIEGKIYTESEGVPPLTDEDRNALASEGQR